MSSRYLSYRSFYIWFILGFRTLAGMMARYSVLPSHGKLCLMTWYTSALFMIHCCCAVIGDNMGVTAKEIEHLDMSFNPVACFLIHVCFYKAYCCKSMPYKDPCLCDLSGVRIKDVGGSHLVATSICSARLSRDMHGMHFLFILLDVVAKNWEYMNGSSLLIRHPQYSTQRSFLLTHFAEVLLRM